MNFSSFSTFSPHEGLQVLILYDVFHPDKLNDPFIHYEKKLNYFSSSLGFNLYTLILLYEIIYTIDNMIFELT